MGAHLRRRSSGESHLRLLLQGVQSRDQSPSLHLLRLAPVLVPVPVHLQGLVAEVKQREQQNQRGRARAPPQQHPEEEEAKHEERLHFLTSTWRGRAAASSRRSGSPLAGSGLEPPQSGENKLELHHLVPVSPAGGGGAARVSLFL